MKGNDGAVPGEVFIAEGKDGAVSVVEGKDGAVSEGVSVVERKGELDWYVI